MSGLYLPLSGVDLGCHDEVLQARGAPAEVLVDFRRRAVAAGTGGRSKVDRSRPRCRPPACGG